MAQAKFRLNIKPLTLDAVLSDVTIAGTRYGKTFVLIISLNSKTAYNYEVSCHIQGLQMYKWKGLEIVLFGNDDALQRRYLSLKASSIGTWANAV